MKKKGSLAQRKMIVGWMFILPALICLLVMIVWPFIKGLGMAFNVDEGISLKNFLRMRKDPNLKNAIQNTLIFVVANFMTLVLALFMAAVLQQKDIKGKGIFRTLLFVPCSMSLVSYSTIFKLMFTNNGLFNNIMMSLGLRDEAFNFFGNVAWARAIIMICVTWRWAGYNMVLYSAGLANIDEDIYDAAELDGAVGLKGFWHISMPLIRPIILLTTITTLNGALNIMDEIMQLTEGAPANKTLSIGIHIYKTAFAGKANLDYASAMAVVLMAVVVIGSLLQMKVGDKRD